MHVKCFDNAATFFNHNIQLASEMIVPVRPRLWFAFIAQRDSASRKRTFWAHLLTSVEEGHAVG